MLILVVIIKDTTNGFVNKTDPWRSQLRVGFATSISFQCTAVRFTAAIADMLLSWCRVSFPRCPSRLIDKRLCDSL